MPSPMEPGTLIADRFVIESLAGEGGMSIVYRAIDRSTGMPVAFKVLRDDTIDPERFVREAVVLAELNHPAIVRHVAHGTLHDHRPYLIMDWLDGQDLDARLARGALTVREAVALTRRVAEGLGAAHARGIIHRDIKPPNIVLPGGDLARARVIDFGIARRVHVTRAATRTGMVLGTPGYMAPEQVRGERDIDVRVDVYSLGCVFFECLTGRCPFEGDTPIAVLARVLLDDCPRVHSLRPDVPESVDALVAAMTARDRSARLSNIDDVLRALDALALDERADVPASVAMRAPSLTHGERRLVCVMAAGGRGADSGAAGDLNATHEHTLATSSASIMASHLQHLVAAHGGRLDLIGGVMLGVFTGDDVARDLVERAARCALRLVNEAAPIVVALITGSAELQGAWPVGEVTERAFRLLDAAVQRGDAGTSRVVVDEVTAALLPNSFEIERTPEADGVEVVLRRCEGCADDRTDIECPPKRTAVHDTPCVGRDRELASLRGSFDAVVSDATPAAVIITGAAGLGKTRLAREFLARIRQQHGAVSVWYARGERVGAGAPLGLLRAVLRNAAAVFNGGDIEAARRQLRERFLPALADVRSEAEARTLIAWVSELAGVPCDAREAPEITAAHSDPQWMAEGMLHAWCELVRAESRTRPLVLVFDDAHWGDDASMRMVDHALRRGDAPWMVLALGREELGERFPRLWEDVGVLSLHLAPLTRRAAERLCRHALGEHVDRARIDRLIDRAEGSPLFLEELLRVGGRDDTLPPSLIAMALARVEALEPSARRVLRAASLFGETFWRGAVATLLGARSVTPGNVAPQADDVSEWLAELERRDVLVRRPHSRFSSDEEWAFRHDVLRAAVETSLTAHDRTLGHALAGSWLRDAGERNPLVLAEHFTLGARYHDAALAFLDAAHMALDAADFVGALDHCAAGIARCNEARNDAQADRDAIDLTHGRLQILEAEVRLWRGEPDQAIAPGRAAMAMLREGSATWFRAAAETGTALGRSGRFDALAAWMDHVGSVTPEADALEPWAIAFARAAVHLYHARLHSTPDRLLAAVERAVAGRALGDLVEARIAGARASRALSLDDHETLEDETLRSMRAYERAGDVRNVATQRAVLGISAVRSGLFDEAFAHTNEALTLIERTKVPVGRGIVFRVRAMVLLARGDATAAEEAITLARRALDKTELYGIRAAAECEHAWLRLVAGDLRGADTLAHAVIAQNVADTLPVAFALAARVATAETRLDDATALVERAGTPIANMLTFFDGEAMVAVARVELLLARNDAQGARTIVDEAWKRVELRAARFRSPARREAFLTRLPVYRLLRTLQDRARA